MSKNRADVRKRERARRVWGEMGKRQLRMLRLRQPTRRQICAAIQMQIDALRDNFTDLFGPTKGQITNTKIRDEIECLEWGKILVQWPRRGKGGPR